MSWKNKIVAVTPLLSLITFLLLGYLGDLWHPGWMVFLLIPIMPFLVGKKKLRFSVSFIITAIYLILIAIDIDNYHPWWVLFLLIPVIHILMAPSDKIFKDKD